MQVMSACRCKPVQDRPSKWSRPSSCLSCWSACSQTQRALMVAANGPMLRLPEDMIRIQEIIWRLRPDVIIETGVAHGGSLVFYASLFEAMGNGRVIGVDVDIDRHNR